MILILISLLKKGNIIVYKNYINISNSNRDSSNNNSNNNYNINGDNGLKIIYI